MPTKLPRTSRAALAILRAKADALGAATVSRRQLREWIGCSDRAARLSIIRLEQAGLIDVEHNCGLSGKVLTNTYHVRGE